MQSIPPSTLNVLFHVIIIANHGISMLIFPFNGWEKSKQLAPGHKFISGITGIKLEAKLCVKFKQSNYT